MSSLRRVRDYFDRAARRFDAIYERDKPFSQRILDRLFRQVVVERFRLICNLAPGAHGFSVLDVGCGSGRYAIALAAAGGRVTGVDVSPAMIELARHEASRAGCADRCCFRVSSFQDFESPESFDVVVATGYFDYLEEPAAELRKMMRHCRGRIFASFPKRWELRAPTRKLRFWLAGGFVRFYARGEIVRLFREAGLPAERLCLIDLGRDVVAVARVA
jgi:2-polyprenyl-3-methyl-5-hydroxy-6-metoxy-1,4-benzoquinol methylase